MIIQPMTTPTPPSAPQKISGIVALQHWGVIRAVGADAATFLQGQLTQDVLTMALGTARLAAFCNAKGRMQASFWVVKRAGQDGSDEFWLVCSADILAQTLKRLSMFVMRAKVKLSDASGEVMLHGLVDDAVNLIANSQDESMAIGQFDNENSIALHPGAGVQRALWCAPAGTAIPTATPLPLSTWLWLEVQSGIAMVTQPIFEAFVPQMLNYESIGGVSFKKGCYPGQEVVARSQFRGTLKRRAYVVHVVCLAQGDHTPFVGQEVFEPSQPDQPCGLIAACAANPAGGFDAIVVLQTSAALSQALALGSALGPPATLLPLPYPLLEDI